MSTARLGGFIIEDQVLVTDDGCELMTQSPATSCRSDAGQALRLPLRGGD